MPAGSVPDGVPKNDDAQRDAKQPRHEITHQKPPAHLIAAFVPSRASVGASGECLALVKLMAVELNSVLGLGREATSLTFLQITLRGVLVFVATLVIVRCGDRRFLSNKTAFDAVLGFILASMLARAVNGTAAFFPTLGGAFVLVMLHRAMAYWAQRSHAFGNLVKGRSDVLVRNGTLDLDGAKRNRLSEHDILEDLRLHGNVGEISDAALAVLERNGQISVVPRGSAPGGE
jgi:uncharacterized protein DUF421